jgi:pimeloyl-ACP methyl ester carboxylesterase
MSAILLDGGIVHYEVIGRGRPIIFLHGWVGSWRYWVPALQSAGMNYRAYALDLWGFGDTAREPAMYSLEKQAALIDLFLQELGIGKVAIVGHGLGAMVGLLFTLRYPNVVDRIMAIESPLDLNSVHPRLRSAPLTELADWLVSKTPEAEPARVDGLKADPAAVTTSFSNPEMFNIASRLLGMNNACLMVYGQNDPAINVPLLDPALTPNMLHVLVLEQTAHFPMLDDMARFNRLLTDFLALQSGESPRDLQLKEEWKRRVR